jgi:hypothetical protein
MLSRIIDLVPKKSIPAKGQAREQPPVKINQLGCHPDQQLLESLVPVAKPPGVVQDEYAGIKGIPANFL